MLCEGCANDHHELCGMQTWCTCDCAGQEGLYLDLDPEAALGESVQEDLDGPEPW
jgi:hypothetical protein